MSTPTLHYIHDPLCGWCYGASPLVQAARSKLAVTAHAGGMMAGAARRAVTPELRQYVMGHDKRIAQLSGQPFGQAYFDGLLQDHGAVFDSAPPITAVLAADQVCGAGLDMLARLQKAHYLEGRRIAELDVIVDLAVDIGLDREAFRQAFGALEGKATQAHIEQSRALLARVGGQGFPTFALERDGQFTRVEIGPYLGQPAAWNAWLTQQVPQQVPVDSTGAQADSAFVCGPDGCAL
jgi:putative protein-disulfide isomerase